MQGVEKLNDDVVQDSNQGQPSVTSRNSAKCFLHLETRTSLKLCLEASSKGYNKEHVRFGCSISTCIISMHTEPIKI